jgi:hypothetical protein
MTQLQLGVLLMESTPDISFAPQPPDGPLAFVTFYPAIGVVYRSAPPDGGRTMFYVDHTGERCTRNIQTAEDALQEQIFLANRHRIARETDREFVQPDHYLSVGAVITPYTH